MKKKYLLPSFSEAAAPVFPILPGLLQFGSSLEAGFSVAAVFVATALLFEILTPLFPKRLISWATVLTVCCAVSVLPGFQYSRGAAALSVCLLLFPLAGRQEKHRDPTSVFIKAVCFLALVIYLGITQEVLGRQAEWPLFQRVPGSLALLILPAMVWPASRKQKALFTGSGWKKFQSAAEV